MKKQILLCAFAGLSACTASHARSIEVQNNITKKMTRYKYFVVNYKPSVFTITVNGQKMDFGEKKTIDIPEDTLKVRYDYEFGHHRKGAKVVEFKIPQETKQVAIKFRWKNKWRILIKGAEPLSVTRIEV